MVMSRLMWLICLCDISTLAIKALYKELSLDVLCGSYQDKKTIYLEPTQSLIFSYKDLRNNHKIKCHLELRLPSDNFGFFVFFGKNALNNWYDI